MVLDGGQEMSDNEKWINYDKPHHLIIREALRIWDLPFEEQKTKSIFKRDSRRGRRTSTSRMFPIR